MDSKWKEAKIRRFNSEGDIVCVSECFYSSSVEEFIENSVCEYFAYIPKKVTIETEGYIVTFETKDTVNLERG